MKPLPKVQAGGIIRVSLDNTWRTPEKILEPVRSYFGGEIPFDAATGLDNPTRAKVYAVGHLSDEGRTAYAYAAARGLALSLAEAPVPNFVAAAAAGLPADHPDAKAVWRSVLLKRKWAKLMEPLEEGRLPFRSGLAVDWTRIGGTYVNPPYGLELKEWLGKIVSEAREGAEIVSLLPCSRWEQAYFTDLLAAANAVCFIRSRVAFISSIDGKAVGGNPSASMLLGFNVSEPDWSRAFGRLGRCFELLPMSDDEALALAVQCRCCEELAPCPQSEAGVTCPEKLCEECLTLACEDAFQDADAGGCSVEGCCEPERSELGGEA